MEVSTHVRYEDLSTTQKARYMIMERKVRIIETENKVLKEKIVSSELERRQLTEKQTSMLGQLQDFDQLKIKLKRLNEDIKAKDALIASMTDQVQAAARRRVDFDLTKEHLDDYKAQLVSTRTPRSSLSPKNSIKSFHSPADSTDLKLKEIAMELRKTQEEVAQLKKSGAYSSPQWVDSQCDKRTGSPINSSYELNSFDDGRHTEQTKKDDLRTPTRESKQSLKAIEESPVLSRLQLVRSMKKPGVSLFRPNVAARKPNQDAGGHKPSANIRTKVTTR